MKRLLTMSLLILSHHAFAVTTLTNNSQLTANNLDIKSDSKSLKEEDKISTPLANEQDKTTHKFNYNHLSTTLWKPAKSSFSMEGLVTPPSGWENQNGETLQGLADNNDSKMAGINASYHAGRFSAETGYLSDISDESDGGKFYLRGSFVVLAADKFNLSVTAKVEALDEDLVDYYYGSRGGEIYIGDSSTNATLGLIGTYSLSARWKIIGAVSSTTLGDEIADSPLIEVNSYNMALIGTTYSF